MKHYSKTLTGIMTALCALSIPLSTAAHDIDPIKILSDADVKAKNYRKADSYIAPDGYKRNLKGSFISRGATKEQKKLGVKIIYE